MMAYFFDDTENEDDFWRLLTLFSYTTNAFNTIRRIVESKIYEHINNTDKM